jgi:hypothetical protein
LGLKIHRGIMCCPPITNLMQHTGTPDETEEELDQDSNHSVQSLHASEEREEISSGAGRETPNKVPGSINKGKDQDRVKWPTSASRKVWQAFDEEVNKVLEATVAGSVDKKMKAMTTIIFSMGQERFGLEEIPKRNIRRKSVSQTTGERRRSIKLELSCAS